MASLSMRHFQFCHNLIITLVHPSRWIRASVDLYLPLAAELESAAEALARANMITVQVPVDAEVCESESGAAGSMTPQLK
jgi:hypothetical protein